MKRGTVSITKPHGGAASAAGLLFVTRKIIKIKAHITYCWAAWRNENDQISLKNNHHNEGELSIIDVFEKSIVFLPVHPK